jgi:transposase-like protein
MRKSDAIAHYDGNISALARALGIDQSTVYSWGDFPPDRRQLQLERITDGKLRAEKGCLERLTGIPKVSTFKQARA